MVDDVIITDTSVGNSPTDSAPMAALVDDPDIYPSIPYDENFNVARRLFCPSGERLSVTFALRNMFCGKMALATEPSAFVSRNGFWKTKYDKVRALTFSKPSSPDDPNGLITKRNSPSTPQITFVGHNGTICWVSKTTGDPLIVPKHMHRLVFIAHTMIYTVYRTCNTQLKYPVGPWIRYNNNCKKLHYANVITKYGPRYGGFDSSNINYNFSRTFLTCRTFPHFDGTGKRDHSIITFWNFEPNTTRVENSLFCSVFPLLTNYPGSKYTCGIKFEVKLDMWRTTYARDCFFKQNYPENIDRAIKTHCGTPQAQIEIKASTQTCKIHRTNMVFFLRPMRCPVVLTTPSNPTPTGRIWGGIGNIFDKSMSSGRIFGGPYSRLLSK